MRSLEIRNGCSRVTFNQLKHAMPMVRCRIARIGRKRGRKILLTSSGILVEAIRDEPGYRKGIGVTCIQHQGALVVSSRRSELALLFGRTIRVILREKRIRRGKSRVAGWLLRREVNGLFEIASSVLQFAHGSHVQVVGSQRFRLRGVGTQRTLESRRRSGQRERDGERE